VLKEVLIHRLKKRQIPGELVQWINTFCSSRRALIIVNGYCSEAMNITYPGLPQGLSLSSILYLFFNADLVDIPINQKKGAITFVDDFTYWQVGQTAGKNISIFVPEEPILEGRSRQKEPTEHKIN
jgi:hypothetical protein